MAVDGVGASKRRRRRVRRGRGGVLLLAATTATTVTTTLVLTTSSYIGSSGSNGPTTVEAFVAPLPMSRRRRALPQQLRHQPRQREARLRMVSNSGGGQQGSSGPTQQDDYNDDKTPELVEWLERSVVDGIDTNQQQQQPEDDGEDTSVNDRDNNVGTADAAPAASDTHDIVDEASPSGLVQDRDALGASLPSPEGGDAASNASPTEAANDELDADAYTAKGGKSASELAATNTAAEAGADYSAARGIDAPADYASASASTSSPSSSLSSSQLSDGSDSNSNYSSSGGTLDGRNLNMERRRRDAMLAGVPSYRTLMTFVTTTVLIWLSEPLLSLVDTTVVGRFASSSTASTAAATASKAVPSVSSSLAAVSAYISSMLGKLGLRSAASATASATAAAASPALLNLAALGPATMLVDCTMYLTYFLSISTTNSLAVSRAKSNEGEMVRTTSHVLGVAAILGMCISAVVMMYGTPILKYMVGDAGAVINGIDMSPDVISRALSYVKIRAAVAPLAVMDCVAQSVCLATLDVKTPMVAVIATSLVNIIGDWLLVVKFGWGLKGAALATALASVVSSVILLGETRRKVGRWRVMARKDREREDWRTGNIAGNGASGGAGKVNGSANGHANGATNGANGSNAVNGKKKKQTGNKNGRRKDNDGVEARPPTLPPGLGVVGSKAIPKRVAQAQAVASLQNAADKQEEGTSSQGLQQQDGPIDFTANALETLKDLASDASSDEPTAISSRRKNKNPIRLLCRNFKVQHLLGMMKASLVMSARLGRRLVTGTARRGRRGIRSFFRGIRGIRNGKKNSSTSAASSNVEVPFVSLPDSKSLLSLVRLAGPIFFVILGKLVCYSAMTLRAADFGMLSLATHNVLLRIFFFYTTFGDAFSQAAQSFLPGAMYGGGSDDGERKDKAGRLEVEVKRTANGAEGKHDATAATISSSTPNEASSQDKLDEFRSKLDRRIRINALLTRMLVLSSVLAVLNSQVATWILHNCGKFFTSDSTIARSMAENSKFLSLSLLVHPAIMLFEGSIIARRDFGFLVKSYCATMMLLLGLLQYGATTFGGVWRAWFIFQVIRLVQFGHGVIKGSGKKAAAATAAADAAA